MELAGKLGLGASLFSRMEAGRGTFSSQEKILGTRNLNDITPQQNSTAELADLPRTFLAAHPPVS
jgi:hypothetical protein